MYRLPFAALLALAAGTACAAQTRTAEELRARAIFSKAISIPTEVGRAQVPVLVEYLAGEFRAAGFAPEDIHVLPVGETASLVVRYRGDGSGGKPILFMAHMDVVTAKREDWQRDPYTLVEENGYFYGRGASDVKDGVATLSATFLRLKAEGFKPRRDLVIVFSGDEETEMTTIQDLVKNHRDLIDAEYALNSDGGGGSLDKDGRAETFSLQTAEKTYASFELTVRNPGGHSSVPRPDNAIYELADALKRLQSYAFPVQWNDTTVAAFRASGAARKDAVGEAMTRFAAHPGDEQAAAVISADPAEVGTVRTTCIPTLLRGGHADNALPQSATATVNCRIFPGVAVETVRQVIQDQVGKDVEVVAIGAPVASDASPLREDVLAAVTRAVHALHPGVPVVPSQSSGATDGLYLRAAGIPTYGVSGMFIKDSDDYSHGLNERVPVQGFYDGLDYWYRLTRDVAMGTPAKGSRP